MLFDENGERLTPTHAIKKGTRYRYYVSRSLITGATKSGSKGRRIRAANLETLVISKLGTFLADREALLDAIQNQQPDAAGQTRLIRRGRQIAEELGTLAPDHRAIRTSIVIKAHTERHIETRAQIDADNLVREHRLS
jgi:site-specific DNA recombinase